MHASPFWQGNFGHPQPRTITVAGCVWLCILLNGRIEDIVRRRLERINQTGAISILRLGRRTIDLLIIFVGVLAALHYFRVNLTAALAGLGVGRNCGRSCCTKDFLENVIGGDLDHLRQSCTGW